MVFLKQTFYITTGMIPNGYSIIATYRMVSRQILEIVLWSSQNYSCISNISTCKGLSSDPKTTKFYLQGESKKWSSMLMESTMPRWQFIFIKYIYLLIFLWCWGGLNLGPLGMLGSTPPLSYTLSSIFVLHKIH